MTELDILKERMTFIAEHKASWDGQDLCFTHNDSDLVTTANTLEEAIDRALVLTMNESYDTVDPKDFKIVMTVGSIEQVLTGNFKAAYNEAFNAARSLGPIELRSFYADGTPSDQLPYRTTDHTPLQASAYLTEWLISALVRARAAENQALLLAYDNSVIAYQILNEQGSAIDVWPAQRTKELANTLTKVGYTVVPLVSML